MMTMPSEGCWVRVDVSKATLDVCVSHPQQALSVTNDPTSIQTLIGTLHDLRPTLVVLEATGGLERAVVAELLVAQIPVAVVNPRHPAYQRLLCWDPGGSPNLGT